MKQIIHSDQYPEPLTFQEYRLRHMRSPFEPAPLTDDEILHLPLDELGERMNALRENRPVRPVKK